MDRCPNCGATVRSGAKFCTTCGMRLPEAAAPQSSETTSRSPFDSTSTVASRWPSRSIYGTGDLAPPDTADQSANGDSGADGAASADGTDTTTATAAETSTESTPTSTWGGWTAPAESAGESTTSTATAWGEDSATASTDQEDSTAESTETKTGETDFLSLPEQPDPSAWATIESELRGEVSAETEPESPTPDAPPVETEAESVEATAAESSADEPAEPAAEATEEPHVAAQAGEETESDAPEAASESPSVERANELLDELRVVVAGLSNTAAQAEPSGPSFADVKPTAEEISQFAALRAAVDSASERPRDIDTMLDLSNRLDDIKALHDAFTRLAEAVSASDVSGDSQPDE